MDGHSSHFCPDMIRMAAKKKVILFTLPPNTTHLTQPLDKGCFGPLKVAWHQACHRFCSQNPGRVVSIYELLSEAWGQSMTVKNITSGFKVTGVYPVDRNAVQISGHNSGGSRGVSLVSTETPFQIGINYNHALINYSC